MGDFERPKPKALSDAELTSALLQLRKQDGYLEKSEALLASQTLLRSADELALAAWQEEITQTLALEIIQTQGADEAQSVDSTQPEEPLFTSQISTVKPKSRSAKQIRAGLYWFQFIGNLLLSGMVAGMLLLWMGITGSNALLAGLVGSALSVVPLLILKVRIHHPLVRAATFLGSKSAYVGAIVFLLLASWLFSEISRGRNSITGYEFVEPNQWLVFVIAGVVALIAILVPLRLIKLLVGLASCVAIVWILIETPLGFWENFPTELTNSWMIGAVAVFLVTATIQIFAQPHETRSAKSVIRSLPLTVLIIFLTISVLVLDPPQKQALVGLLVSSAVFLSLAATGRDIARTPVARLAALAFILPVLAFDILDAYGAMAIAGVSYFLIVALLDQLFRRTSLHIPSLGVGYGFYGAFQFTTWLGLAASLTAAALYELGQLIEIPGQSSLQVGFLIGLVAGTFFGFMRAPVVLRQNREIKLVEIHNNSSNSLLGL